MEQITDKMRASKVWDLARATARLDRTARVVEGTLHLGTADMRLMWLLADGEPRTMKEISQQLLLEASTVNRQVNAALKSGLVERCDREGAARPIRASAEGERQFTEDVTRAMSLMEAGLAAVPPEEVPSFLANLTRFTEAYRAAAEAVVEGDMGA